MTDLVFRGAGELAGMVRAGECSATEALEAHLEQVERHNDTLNVVVSFDVERARESARRADAARARGERLGPLQGLPMTVKDAFETEGLLTTFGVPTLGRYVPERDATAVARLRAAGAVVFGKTNVPLLCYDWQCKHPKFGRTANPWDPSRVPGGSSGGAAAALAAGMTPLEIGSDIAGSIRVPCHFSGVCGIRPTEGSVSSAGATRAPGYPRSLRSFFAAGPMARSVADLRLGLSVVRGPDHRDWQVPPVPLETEPVPLRGLRVGFATECGGVPVSAETRATIESLAADLETEGCHVEPASPRGFDWELALETWARIQGYECSGQIPPLARWAAGWFMRAFVLRFAFGRSGFSRGIGDGLTFGARRYFEALTARDELVARLDGFLAAHDVWIAPASATPAFTHRRTGKPIEVNGRPVPYSLAMGMYNCPTALGGHPVVSLPAGLSDAGLPIGIQLHARRWSDGRLLSIAERIEKLRPARECPGYR